MGPICKQKLEQDRAVEIGEQKLQQGNKKLGFIDLDRILRDELPLGARGQKEGTREVVAGVLQDLEAQRGHGCQQAERGRDDATESLEGVFPRTMPSMFEDKTIMQHQWMASWSCQMLSGRQATTRRK